MCLRGVRCRSKRVEIETSSVHGVALRNKQQTTIITTVSLVPSDAFHFNRSGLVSSLSSLRRLDTSSDSTAPWFAILTRTYLASSPRIHPPRLLSLFPSTALAGLHILASSAIPASFRPIQSTIGCYHLGSPAAQSDTLRMNFRQSAPLSNPPVAHDS